MKLLRLLVALAVVGAVLWFAFPALRAKARQAFEEHGGWTEDARREDPVGFLEYAEERLRDDLDAFRRSRADMAAAAETSRVRAEESAQRVAAADAFAGRFRVAYAAAEPSGAWPVTVEGASYGRDELIAQVEQILGEREMYAELATGFEEVVRRAAAQDVELAARITRTEAALENLDVQIELVRVRELSTGVDELLGNIDALLGENDAARDGGGGPIRTVDKLLARGAEPDESTGVDALAFLDAAPAGDEE